MSNQRALGPKWSFRHNAIHLFDLRLSPFWDLHREVEFHGPEELIRMSKRWEESPVTFIIPVD